MALRTREEFERLRQRGVAMMGEGTGPSEIARELGVDRKTVHNWRKRGTGEEAKIRKPGPPSRLDAWCGAQLLKMLEEGPEAHGWVNGVWTGRRIATLIQREFGVRYHYKYIPVLMREMGWSWQKPRRRASERDEAEIARWIAEEWPRIKKKPGGARPR